MRGVDTETSTPHDSLNSHSLLGVVDPADRARHGELGLGEQRDHEVGLVVAGRRDDDVARLELGLLERGQLARVGEQPLRLGHGVGADRRGGLVDQQDGVPVVDELLGDRTADGACSGDHDAHQSSSGPASRAASAVLAWSSRMNRLK